MSTAASDAGAAVRFESVEKQLGGKQILRGLSFEVPRGTSFVIMGPSGSGKSVTLKHIVGILAPDAGRVLVFGREPGQLSRSELASLRSRIGLLFQDGALINWMNLEDNVALPLREVQRLPEREVRPRVAEALERVHLADAAQKMPSEISGGMRKRAALARAIVSRPELLLYDEPDAGLDPATGGSINRLIRRVQRELGATGVIVTHSRSCALTVGDRIGIFEQGRMASEGTAEEMATSSDPRVRIYLGIDGEATTERSDSRGAEHGTGATGR
ncbi:MAG: ATP-binding cassette domain-containing protein [Planctomycetes bacterium]|nr:ATP-binding cassette domain-containing protein [Planctomycetota bacterium]